MSTGLDRRASVPEATTNKAQRRSTDNRLAEVTKCSYHKEKQSTGIRADKVDTCALRNRAITHFVLHMATKLAGN
jgi:hypothetical protein